MPQTVVMLPRMPTQRWMLRCCRSGRYADHRARRGRSVARGRGALPAGRKSKASPNTTAIAAVMATPICPKLHASLRTPVARLPRELPKVLLKKKRALPMPRRSALTVLIRYPCPAVDQGPAAAPMKKISRIRIQGFAALKTRPVSTAPTRPINRVGLSPRRSQSLPPTMAKTPPRISISERRLPVKSGIRPRSASTYTGKRAPKGAPTKLLRNEIRQRERKARPRTPPPNTSPLSWPRGAFPPSATEATFYWQPLCCAVPRSSRSRSPLRRRA